MSALDLRIQLVLLQTERFEARSAGLEGCRIYMDDLDGEIAACRAALVSAAVIEIAELRAELFGKQRG